MSKKKLGKMGNRPCIYCGSIEDITRDHVPPQCLFNTPLPKNMLTVPSCRTCNKSFEKDDQYFRDMLISCATVSSNPDAQAVKEKFWRSLVKPEAKGYKHYILSRLAEVEIVTPSGIYLGTSPAMKIDAKRIDRVTNRIAGAIFYKVHQRPVPSTHEIKIMSNGEFLSEPKEFKDFAGLNWRPTTTIGSDIFGYTYALVNDDLDSMIFLYRFYGKLWFYGWVAPADLRHRQSAHFSL